MLCLFPPIFIVIVKLYVSVMFSIGVSMFNCRVFFLVLPCLRRVSSCAGPVALVVVMVVVLVVALVLVVVLVVVVLVVVLSPGFRL